MNIQQENSKNVAETDWLPQTTDSFIFCTITDAAYSSVILNQML